MSRLRIAVGQFNFSVGAIEENAEKMMAARRLAEQKQADIVVFPELALSGYPPEDLLLRADFQQRIQTACATICQQPSPVPILFGYPDSTETGLYNAMALIDQQHIVANYHKRCLPNYGLFDEQRYFSQGTTAGLIHLKGLTIGLLICEDLWREEPILSLKNAGTQLVICINASPFDRQKAPRRLLAVQTAVRMLGCPILYVHGVGGQDDFVFDGGSFAVSATGEISAHADFFAEQLWFIDLKPTRSISTTSTTNAIYAWDLSHQDSHLSQHFPSNQADEAQLYQALVFAIRDYVTKNDFPGVLLGLSGGIDSALVLAIAIDALGVDRVHTVSLPSRYTSELSDSIVATLVQTLGVRHSTFSIEPSFTTFLTTLGFDPDNPPPGTMAENIQARCRAVLLMALSNQSGELLLNTSNKSELAMGYGTLYGDMAGGFSVIKDVFKTQVYQLARYRNTLSSLFPEALLVRAPSAELAENQYDENTLPPYSELDRILGLYLEEDKSLNEIVQQGFPQALVENVLRTVDRNEYKRRQAAIGPRVSPRAFGRERRYPISSGFSSSIA